MAAPPYAVVTFLDDDGGDGCSEVVPVSWLLEKKHKAYWPDPPKKGQVDRRSKMVMALQKPDKDWPSYSCRVRHTFEKYNKARAAANKQNDQADTVATEPSDLEGRKRRRIKNKKYESSSSDDESLIGKKRKTKTVALDDVSDEVDNSDEENAKLQETIEQLLNVKGSTTSGKKITQTRLKISEEKTSKPAEKANTDGSNRKPTKTMKTTSLSEILHKSRPGNGNCSKKSDKIILGNSTVSCVQNTSGTDLALDHEDEGFMEAINMSIDNLSSETGKQGKLKGDSLQNSEKSISGPVRSRTTSPVQNALEVDLTHAHENDEGCFTEGNSSKGPDASGSKNPKNTQLMSRVKMNMLSELSSKVDVILLNQARLFTLLAPEEEFVERPPNLPHTPLKNLKAYYEFEEFLSEPVNADALVSHLKISVMSISSEKEATAAMLKSIITNNLSRALSWGGGAGKEKFKHSKIMNVISRVILKLFPKSKLDEAKGKVQRWLETSNQRKPEEEDSNSE